MPATRSGGKAAAAHSADDTNTTPDAAAVATPRRRLRDTLTQSVDEIEQAYVEYCEDYMQRCGPLPVAGARTSLPQTTVNQVYTAVATRIADKRLVSALNGMYSKTGVHCLDLASVLGFSFLHSRRFVMALRNELDAGNCDPDRLVLETLRAQTARREHSRNTRYLWEPGDAKEAAAVCRKDAAKAARSSSESHLPSPSRSPVVEHAGLSPLQLPADPHHDDRRDDFLPASAISLPEIEIEQGRSIEDAARFDQSTVLDFATEGDSSYVNDTFADLPLAAAASVRQQSARSSSAVPAQPNKTDNAQDGQETDAQETKDRETDARETDVQEADDQETDAQETDAQETDAYATDAQETDAYATDAQETDAQETDAQETDDQDTDAQDTEDEETDAQDTDAEEAKARDIESCTNPDPITPTLRPRVKPAESTFKFHKIREHYSLRQPELESTTPATTIANPVIDLLSTPASPVLGPSQELAQHLTCRPDAPVPGGSNIEEQGIRVVGHSATPRNPNRPIQQTPARAFASLQPQQWVTGFAVRCICGMFAQKPYHIVDPGIVKVRKPTEARSRHYMRSLAPAQIPPMALPICLDNTHWTAAVLNPTLEQTTCVLYDPLHSPDPLSSDRDCSPTKAAIQQFYNSLPAPQAAENLIFIVASDSVLQKDSYNCGVLVMFDLILRMANLPAQQEVDLDLLRHLFSVALVGLFPSELPTVPPPNLGASSGEKDITPISQDAPICDAFARGAALASRTRLLKAHCNRLEMQKATCTPLLTAALLLSADMSQEPSTTPRGARGQNFDFDRDAHKPALTYFISKVREILAELSRIRVQKQFELSGMEHELAVLANG